MKVLLDTHTLLWANLSPRNLSRAAAAIILNEENTILVSAATAWEIATKVRSGKMPEATDMEREFMNDLRDLGYTLLPVTVEEGLRAGRLPGSHRDPFDRMLAAQALAQDIPILSIDPQLDQFHVRRIW